MFSKNVYLNMCDSLIEKSIAIKVHVAGLRLRYVASHWSLASWSSNAANYASRSHSQNMFTIPTPFSVLASTSTLLYILFYFISCLLVFFVFADLHRHLLRPPRQSTSWVRTRTSRKFYLTKSNAVCQRRIQSSPFRCWKRCHICGRVSKRHSGGFGLVGIVDLGGIESWTHYNCRMYPVVIGNGRSLQSDAVIGGYHIPKGVRETKGQRLEVFVLTCSIILNADPRHLPPPGGV